MDLILNYVNPVHNFPANFFIIHTNINTLSTPASSKLFLSLSLTH